MRLASPESAAIFNPKRETENAEVFFIMSKVLLILVDGMTPAGLAASETPVFPELRRTSRFTLEARTVMPSVTLPCHMSLFHSVGTERHGILTNTYVPQVRPVKGLCEVLSAAGKKCAIFYNWEQLRDLTRPGSLSRADFVAGITHGYEAANRILADRVVAMFRSGETPDFIFLYLGWSDEAGHKYGWMTPEYLAAVRQSFECIRRVLDVLPEEYRLIVTADHGGHARSHGTDAPEDMTIPIFLRHSSIAPGRLPDGATILDIAPTIAALLGVPADPDWEGKPLV